MKTCLNLTMLSAAALLSGCAFGQHSLVLESVGPPATPSYGSATQGTLVVFSAYDVHAPSMGDFDDVQRHSDYKIFSEDGKLLRIVHNHPHSVDEEPARVELPPGMYRVIANSNGYGVVTMPVVIKPGQTTTVHVEGGGSWPDETAFTKDNSVRLPDGEIVGYRAAAENMRIP